MRRNPYAGNHRSHPLVLSMCGGQVTECTRKLILMQALVVSNIHLHIAVLFSNRAILHPRYTAFGFVRLGSWLAVVLQGVAIPNLCGFLAVSDNTYSNCGRLIEYLMAEPHPFTDIICSTTATFCRPRSKTHEVKSRISGVAGLL